MLETSIDGARAVLINITGGTDTSILDINEAATLITQAADPEANIIFGAGIDESLTDEVHVTVIATGFEKTPFVTARPAVADEPAYTRPVAAPAQAETARPAAPASDGPEVPSFVNQPRYVMPSREERRSSLYGSRSFDEPAQRATRAPQPEEPAEQPASTGDSFYDEDPFEEAEQQTEKKSNRRGFTPDIPPFLRGRRK